MEWILFPLCTGVLGNPKPDLLVAKTGLKFTENRNLASFNFTTLLLPQHNQDMSHLALKVCKRKPSLKICNWKGWCCSTTWQPLLVLNVLLPWREKSWHKKSDPQRESQRALSQHYVHKSHLMLYKNVLCTLVYKMYMIPDTFWKTWSSTKSQQKLVITLPTFSKNPTFFSL